MASEDRRRSQISKIYRLDRFLQVNTGGPQYLILTGLSPSASNSQKTDDLSLDHGSCVDVGCRFAACRSSYAGLAMWCLAEAHSGEGIL
jgi:hypothetical protein